MGIIGGQTHHEPLFYGPYDTGGRDMMVFPMTGQPFMEGKTLEQRVAELEARLDAIVASQHADRWMGDDGPRDPHKYARIALEGLPETAFDVNPRSER